MACAGMLLTGGSSRRLGRDKATLGLGSEETLARRTARLLGAVTEVAVEVGHRASGLRPVTDATPGAGPLAAVATGWAALKAEGWTGAVLVVATDLPLLTEPFLAWLAGHRDGRTVVPHDESGRAQPLCARYHPEDLARAQRLVEAGRRAMMDLMAVTDVLYVEAGAWSATGAPPGVLFDVDTPADLARLPGLEAGS